MTNNHDMVLREALSLPARERAQVAADLIASLDEEHESAGEVSSSWALEIERRAREVRAGSATGEAWEAVRDRIAGGLRAR